MRKPRNATILLVEDEPLIAISEKAALERYGYKIVMAATGEEAIEAFMENAAIDLVLMDIDLGEGIDGTEAAKAMLKSRLIPVVFLSSHTEPAIVERTESITSYGYVVKNSGIVVLDASIKMAFKLFAANRTVEAEKERLRTTLHSIGDAVIVADNDGIVTRMNPNAESLTGWRIGEAEGRPIEEIFNIVNARTGEKARNPVKAVFESGSIVGLANHSLLISKDGSERQIADSGAPIRDGEGRIAGAILVFRDVSEEYRIHEALEASEKHLREAQAMAGIGHWEWNVTTGDVEWSEELFKIFRLDPREFVPRIDSILSFSPWPEDSQRGRELIDRALSSPEPGSYEQKFLRPDNSVGYYFSTFQGKYDKEGNLTYIVGTVQDITERKRAEERLRNANLLMEQAFEQTPVPLVLVSMPDAVFRIVNPACRRFLGIEDEASLVGTPLKDLRPSWRDFDMQGRVGEAEARPLARSLGGSRTEGEERRIVRKDGTERFELVTATPIRDDQGRIVAGYQIMIDITDRKLMENGLMESDERYRRITASVMDYFLTVHVEDGKATRTTHGEACIGVTGYAAGEFAADPYLWYTMIVPEDRDLVAGQAADILSGAGARAVSHRIRRKDGEIRWVENTPVPHRDHDGKLVAYDGLIRDITDRKLADDRIAALFEEKELLLREAHHRIKNNMNTMMALLSMQADGSKDPTVAGALRDAGGRLRSMGVLYDKLYRSKDLSSMPLGEYLPALVDQIVELFPNAPMVRIVTRVDDFPLDARELSTLGIIVNELVTNIMKHAFKGRSEGTVTISASRRESRAVIAIGDDGVGMPEAIGLEESSGFGLHLVAMLGAQLGGAIRVERGNGTRFILEFEA
jgi:PAS domain S-box-containing protein